MTTRDNQAAVTDCTAPVENRKSALSAMVESLAQSCPETLGWLYWTLLETMERI